MLSVSPLTNAPFGGFAYPFDFSFTLQIWGISFRPGEQVTVSASGVTAAPQTAVAEEDGSFAARMSFTWTFCGPDHVAKPPPVITATGDQGSVAQSALPAPPCPQLVAIVPSPSVPSAGGGTIEPSGTAVAVSGTAVTVGPGVINPPPGGPIALPTPGPPQPVTIEGEGFGFVPGELVTIRGTGFSVTPSAVQITADAMGRLRFSLSALMPLNPCTRPAAELLAQGDRGSSARAIVISLRPLPLGIPCAAGPSPGPPGNPPEGQGAPPPQPVPFGTPVDNRPPAGTITPPLQVTPGSPENPSPLPQPIGLKVRPAITQPGKLIRVTITPPHAGIIHLSVRYPNGRTGHKTWHIGHHPVSIRWSIPANAGQGAATVRIVLDPGHTSLARTFLIR